MKTSRMLFFTAVLATLSLTGFAQKADSSSIKLEAKLMGHWEVQSVYRGSRNITATKLDSAYAKTIEFTADAKYVMSRGSRQLDNGSFNTNETTNVLYLESNNDLGHLHEWKISLRNGEILTLTGKKGTKMEGVQYVCVMRKVS